MQLEQLRGHVDTLILAVMTGDDSRRWYGYALIERMRDVSGGEVDLPEGTVYPALHRLERAGCLASTFAMSNGRQRRYYVVTERGRTLLAERNRQWAVITSAIADALAGRTCPSLS